MAALASLGDPRAMPVIDDLLATGGKPEKRKAVGWIKGIGNDEAMSKLAGLLADRETRGAAHQALLQIGEPAIPHVRDWLIETARGKDIPDNRIWGLASVGCISAASSCPRPARPNLAAASTPRWSRARH